MSAGQLRDLVSVIEHALRQNLITPHYDTATAIRSYK